MLICPKFFSVRFTLYNRRIIIWIFLYIFTRVYNKCIHVCISHLTVMNLSPFLGKFLPLLLVRVLTFLQRRLQWPWAAPSPWFVKSSPTPLLWSPGSKTALRLNRLAMFEFFQVWDYNCEKSSLLLYIWLMWYLMGLSSTGARTLQILNAKKEDAGRYTCVATNEAGETLKHYEVKVFGEIPSPV